MSQQNLYTLSLDSVKYICSLINKTVDLPATILDDLHIQSTTTYSSYKLDTLLKALKDENIEYCDAAIAGLNKLSKEIITDKSQITNENTIYLLLKDPVNNIYEQWLLINGTPQMIGTTEMKLDSVYTKEEADDRYALLTDFKTLSDEVAGIKTKIGTETLTTTATTLTGAINELEGREGVIVMTKAEHTQLVANGSVTLGSGETVNYDANGLYVISDDEDSVSITNTISSSSTNSEVPTAKAVNDLLQTEGSGNLTIPLNEDLNNLTYNRTRVWMNSQTDQIDTFTNMPSGKYGECAVIFIPYENTTDEFGEQIFVGNTNRIFIRNKFHAEWTAWKRVCTTSVADVPKTIITSEYTDITLNQNCTYTVINGICYVSLWGFQSATTGQHVISTSMPKAKATVQSMCCYGNEGNTGACIFVNDSNNTNLYAEINKTGQPLYGGFSYPVAE